ncbi:MAG: class I tRNA ligase family protein [Candidatus Paceibacterota bacterium]
MEEKPKNNKTSHAEREEKILKSWQEKQIFQKSLDKNKDSGKEFIFYEGPPTANGHPGIHHLEARAFKDAIPRYKTMRGFHVRRKGGWDTHGLPVEIQVEKQLGLKSKKEVETYGIEKFNEKCKESVWQYVHEWEDFTARMGYWVDLKDPYITYKPYYIESVWNIVKEVAEKGLVYKDYKVVPWCPRCGTGLSSHELAQGYETVKDLSVYVKFKISDKKYFLAWTTTPWTLPGNVALAVGEKIDYVEIALKETGENLILAKERLSILKEQAYEIVKEYKGKDLVGMKYEPLYPFLSANISGVEKEKLGNAFQVYTADFVTTTDGTGIVHTAVMYGQDDFELGTAVGLPKYHLVNEDGTFKAEAGFLTGMLVKDSNTDVEIIKDLARREGGSLLHAKEKYEHSYPHCWRCHTPLIYFARDSWYIRMSELRHDLVKENEHINWEPEHIKEGRFGEWLREVKDWAISRERYWGTPLPIWECGTCHKRKVIGSVDELKKPAQNNYFLMRHGEAENNTVGILNNRDLNKYHLTELGKSQVEKATTGLKKNKIDIIYVSPLLRTQETARIVAEKIGIDPASIITDARLHEFDTGVLDGHPLSELTEKFPDVTRFEKWPEGGENYQMIKNRVGEFLYELEGKHKGKNILIVTHEKPSFLLMSVVKGLDRNQILDLRVERGCFLNAEVQKLDFAILPHNHEYELDLHRPYIDEVKLACECGGEMIRVKEVLDVWFDSGSMPFSQDHYPFENKKYVDKEGYPADFIAEAIDQTRGWFYTLHAIGVLLGKGKAYKNVICLGHILDPEGKKMSKSIGNVVDPFLMMDKYGADALRFWMYSVNQPGDSKNFEERTVDEVVKKVFNITLNVLAFYELYADKPASHGNSSHVLDKWIISRLNQTIEIVTSGLDTYKFFEPSRAIRDFVGDLSQWYIRRSRDRFKGDDEADKNAALQTTRYVLITLAKLMAPLTPFFAEHIYHGAGGEKESVHLEDWPEGGKVDEKLSASMENVRKVVTLGLEARMTAKINVRQPLQSLSVRTLVSAKDVELLGLIKEEVNVKEVKINESIIKEVELDTVLTPALKEEGSYRELVRAVQDMRKEKGLTVNDRIVLRVETDAKGQEFVSKYKDLLKKATLLEDVRFETGLVGDAIQLGDFTIKVAL